MAIMDGLRSRIDEHGIDHTLPPSDAGSTSAGAGAAATGTSTEVSNSVAAGAEKVIQHALEVLLALAMDRPIVNAGDESKEWSIAGFGEESVDEAQSAELGTKLASTKLTATSSLRGEGMFGLAEAAIEESGEARGMARVTQRMADGGAGAVKSRTYTAGGEVDMAGTYGTGMAGVMVGVDTTGDGVADTMGELVDTTGAWYTAHDTLHMIHCTPHMIP
jgi:hypothetical protein